MRDQTSVGNHPEEKFRDRIEDDGTTGMAEPRGLQV